MARNRRLGKNVKDFGDEVTTIGGRLNRRGDEWKNWAQDTFGVIGPLIASIFGIIVIAIALWFMRFINTGASNSFILYLSAFLDSNMGILFVAMLLFSYARFFSRHKSFRPFLPIVWAARVTVGLWIVGSVFVFTYANPLTPIGNWIVGNLSWLFVLLLVIGYTFFALRKPAEIIYKEKAVKMQKTVPYSKNRLYRSGNDRILGGVCGGIAEYLGVDPTIIRILWILGTLLFGVGILLYIILWIIVPRNPKHKWN